jgi:hypothetical protein
MTNEEMTNEKMTNSKFQTPNSKGQVWERGDWSRCLTNKGYRNGFVDLRINVTERHSLTYELTLPRISRLASSREPVTALILS